MTTITFHRHFFKFRSGPHVRHWCDVIMERMPDTTIVFRGTEHTFLGVDFPHDASWDAVSACIAMSDRFRSPAMGNCIGVGWRDFEWLGTDNPFSGEG